MDRGNGPSRRSFLKGVGIATAACIAGGGAAMAQAGPARARPLGVVRLALRAANPGSLREFYTKVLECPELSAPEGGLAVRAGETEITFERADKGEPFYHSAFNIPENMLASAKRWLAARTAILKRPDGRDEYHFAGWNAHAFYFLDPAGNILEFIARHNLKNGREGEFSARDILGVSEIGLVVGDVVKTVDAGRERLGLGVFAGARSDELAAIGDDHRLLIVVKRGRVWNGGTKAARPAAVFPVRAEIAGTEGKLESAEGEFSVTGV
ncbi:MAG: twin-arginine translocation signal domain-containing protein [Phycisphaerales bacterium]